MISMTKKRLTRRALPEQIPPWGIAVLESHHAPDFVMEWRQHAFIKIIYVLSGNGEVHIDNSCLDFKQKDIFVIPVGRRNRIVDSPNEPASLYVLCITPAVLGFDPGIEQRLTEGRLPRSDYSANQVERLLRHLLFQQSYCGQEASLAMAASALNLLQIVVEKPVPGKQYENSDSVTSLEMVDYLRHLDSHFFEPEDINTAAQRLGISRRAFTKQFRQATGTSWLQYVRSKAVGHAACLLLETSAPIPSVAFECGFADLSTFYRQFKAVTGSTPASWRKQETTEPTKS